MRTTHAGSSDVAFNGLHGMASDGHIPIEISDHNPQQKPVGSDVWWISVVMDPRARLNYKLAPDVPQIADAQQQGRMILATLQRNPLNPCRLLMASWSGQDDRH